MNHRLNIKDEVPPFGEHAQKHTHKHTSRCGPFCQRGGGGENKGPRTTCIDSRKTSEGRGRRRAEGAVRPEEREGQKRQGGQRKGNCCMTRTLKACQSRVCSVLSLIVWKGGRGRGSGGAGWSGVKKGWSGAEGRDHATRHLSRTVEPVQRREPHVAQKTGRTNCQLL